MEKIDGKSLDLREDSIDKLKQLFPEIVTEGEQINFEKLKAILTDDLDESNEKYTFTWNGKSEAMRIANTPTSGTLKPVLKKSQKVDSTENIYIEGDNLEVLKLLQKSYSHKVDVIYIDPPYNTGKDFVYKDNYKDSLENYFVQTGQVDEEGYKLTTNVESNGRFHSDWLNMMYPRLKLARNLLTNTGVIFISIDDNEQNNLKKIADEIFGEDNFIGLLPRITKRSGKSHSDTIAKNNDYLMIYAKNKAHFKFKKIEVKVDGYTNVDEYYDSRGPYKLNQTLDYDSLWYNTTMDFPIVINGKKYYPGGDEKGHIERHQGNHNLKDWVWRWSQDKLDFGLEHGFVEIKDGGRRPRIYTKTYLNVTISKKNGEYFIEEIDRGDNMSSLELTKNVYSNDNATKDLSKINMNNSFEFPKPVSLIKTILNLIDIKNDFIILDFFSGSGTTAEAVLRFNAENKKNVKYILVQLPELLSMDSQNFKKGFETINDLAVERIKRAGKKLIEDNPNLEDELDIGLKYFKLDTSNIKKWNIDEDNIEDELLLFTDNFEEGSTHDDIVYELLLKQGIELTVPIEKESFEGTSIYIVANGAMFVVIGNNIDESIGEYIRDYESMFNQDEDSEIVVAFQDIGFEDDSAKLNTFEILKAAGFKDENIFTI